MDYRVRLQGGARNIVTAKRSYANYLLPYKAMNWSKPKTSLINTESFASSSSDKKNDEMSNEERDKLLDVYLFREGRIPPYRQMFYQYGDLQLQDKMSTYNRKYFKDHLNNLFTTTIFSAVKTILIGQKMFSLLPPISVNNINAFATIYFARHIQKFWLEVGNSHI